MASCGSNELPQETYIVLTEQADIVDAIFIHGGPFYAHAKCKPGVFVVIDAAIFQHFRVDHAAAQYFEPAGAFAYGTSCAMTYGAADIHFSAWLRKGKIAWSEADTHIFSKHLLYKKV